MIRTARQSTGVLRHVFLTLAAMAIALKILIPPGFMAGPPTNDLPFALVLCTGQGVMVVAPGDTIPHEGRQHPAPSGSHDSPCLFAGHGLLAPPSSAADPSLVEFLAYAYRPPAAVADLAPGRGLTGPPLPARGPPALLI